MSSPDFEPVLDVLRRQRDDGLHLGAQICVELHGERVLDTAIGESVPGRDLRPDDVMLWYSSSKPSTAVAVLQLWERGRLGLDDLVADYVPGWGAGKEHCTVRHVLTHTGGFPMYREGLGDQNLPFEEKVARIAAHPAEWEPGTEAAYHLTTGWTVLGAVIEAVDGRPVRQYLDEEVFGPAGLASTHCALTPDQQAELGDRLVPMHWRGHTLPVRTKDGRLEQVPYNIEERGHNETWYRARVEPGSACQGPASDLARFYSCLLGH
ncbi:MAG TPA: serine hydrolase domain-containing protein, partial [Acidimicrobiia bacterium]|nr:serine hydrolase domain-containing protein [Acidimicrobiia bacterium]